LGGNKVSAFTKEVNAITDPKIIKYPQAHQADTDGLRAGSFINKELL
jgi:hypothetical protein